MLSASRIGFSGVGAYKTVKSVKEVPWRLSVVRWLRGPVAVLLLLSVLSLPLNFWYEEGMSAGETEKRGRFYLASLVVTVLNWPIIWLGLVTVGIDVINAISWKGGATWTPRHRNIARIGFATAFLSGFVGLASFTLAAVGHISGGLLMLYALHFTGTA